MDSLYVIDASGFLYRSYHAIKNMTNSKGQSTNALFGFVRSLQKLKKDFDPKHIVAVFDGPNNAKSRLDIYPEYKAHRQAMPEDLRYQIEWAKEFCQKMGIPLLSIPNVEADDTMGTIASWGEKQGINVYLCTSDKDMAQMVSDKVFLLNTHKDNLLLDAKKVEEVYGVPPEQIIDLLAITGDASDNIPGIKGFGPKTAISLLQQFGSLNKILESADQLPEKKRITIEEEASNAKLSQKLVTIDTHVPIPHELTFYSLSKTDPAPLKELYVNMNFLSLLKEIEVTSPQATDETLQYHLVETKDALESLISLLLKKEQICFDTETTSIDPIKAELVGVGLGTDPKEAWYVPLNGLLDRNFVISKLKILFESPLKFYAHNAKYDYQVLLNEGIEVQNLCFDTILASYLLNAAERHHSLDSLSLQHFGKVKIPTSDLIGKGAKTITMKEVPIKQVAEYCCEDVDYTIRLKNLFEKQIYERKLDKLLFEIELPLVKVLAGMERHGIYLDIPCINGLRVTVNQEISRLEKEIYALAGEEFNIKSTKQLSDILFVKLMIPPPKKTATGFSTNADVLETLSLTYPIASKIMEYRVVEKLRSTYIDALPLEVNEKTHRIHCSFNQTVAATGRLSCQNPNLQNIPMRTEMGRQIREAFRPEKTGWSYLGADYSQIELRLLAHLSEDPTLLEAFLSNQDIHTHTAAKMFDLPIEQVTKEQRTAAKTVNFGILYGQQAFGLSQVLHISVKEANRFIDSYFKRYSHVQAFLEKYKQQARESGKTVTLFQRERLIPEINSKNKMLSSVAERLAVNSPIQGTAADMIKIAMLRIDAEIKNRNLKSYMILQVHDELIFEVQDEEIEIMKVLVKNHMENVIKLKVPLIVDIAIGRNWKEC